MRYKKLGKSKISISSVGLGTNFVTDTHKNEKKLMYLMQEALDNGINFYDTAEVYHNGHSETLLGKAFKKKRDSVIIATKFSSEHSRYKDVIKSAEGSLKRLQTDYIDLYQIHWPNPVVPFEETLKALEKLVQSGKVKSIGVSNFSLSQLRIIKKISKQPIISLQTEYNLLERSIENDLLPYNEKNMITTIAYTPLNSGNILKTEKKSKIFLHLTKKYNKTISQIILNFLMSHSSIVAIPATTSISHMKENAKSTEFLLEKSDSKLLSKTFAIQAVNIDTRKIKVITAIDHDAYKSIEEALANKLNFFPSPQMLSVDIQKGDFLKPIRVRRLEKKDGIFEYELLNGRIRYWAWVIAYKGKKPIHSIIED